ncbi:MAG: hypothetical protein R6V73_12900 [Anaerolineales bacterium]
MQMIVRRSNLELWLAVLFCVISALGYLWVMNSQGSIPPAGELFGHGIGILGFAMMLMTETLYSIRKRSRRARWGRISSWLSFHIFTGITGPFLVMLHSSWKFNGLAGVLTLMMVVVVGSGVFGRYLYTAIPRTADGKEAQRELIEAEIHALEKALQSENQPASKELKRLERQQRDLNRQLQRLSAARRSLSLWHAVHIPLGMAMFAAALVHILGSLYYATFLH